MLHPDLLRQLCRARDRLVGDEEPQPSIPVVARDAGIAQHHFIRLFRAVFGDTPHQYRSAARVDRAKTLLIVSNDSVTDICMALGFTSLGSFSTMFTRRTGLSPTAWRQKWQPVRPVTGGLPPLLIPGCLTLMAHLPARNGNFREAESSAFR